MGPDAQGRKYVVGDEMARRPPFDIPLFTFDARAVRDRIREIAAAAQAAHRALLPLIAIMRAYIRGIRTDYR